WCRSSARPGAPAPRPWAGPWCPARRPTGSCKVPKRCASPSPSTSASANARNSQGWRIGTVLPRSSAFDLHPSLLDPMRPTLMLRSLLIACLLTAVCCLSPAAVSAAKVKVWHHHNAAHHDKAQFKHAVVSSEGALRLSRELKLLAGLDATHVWDVI